MNVIEVKAEIEASMADLMMQPGAMGYVVINFDGKRSSMTQLLGIPVKYWPENIPAVQYAALVSDLVQKTKHTLKQLNNGDTDFQNLRLRTKTDMEMIVTDYIINGNEYILVTLQNCSFKPKEEETEEGEKEGDK